jgi:hypothetical protein
MSLKRLRSAKCTRLFSYGQSIKLGITASLLSLFVYNFYWLEKSSSHLINLIFGFPDAYLDSAAMAEAYLLPRRNSMNFVTSFMATQVGLTARFLGIIFALIGFYLLWRPKKENSSKARRLLGCAIAFEAVYWITLSPSAWRLWMPETIFLDFGYILQIAFAAPVLIILAIKMGTDSKANAQGLGRWISFAFLGYVLALWANAVFRWIDMLSANGIVFLLTGTRAVGFLSTAILMTLASVFASFGVCKLIKQDRKGTVTLFGLSLTMIGLQYAIYVVYSYCVGAVSYMLLIDVWTIPLLFLGLVVSIAKTNPREPIRI